MTVQETVSPLIAGAMASGSLWLLSGWDPVDREETIGRWWRSCARTATRAQRVVDRVLASFRARMGPLGRAGAAVGSGEVADMIDIVGLGLSAGLSFDAALSLYCDGRPGVLAGRLERALLSWQSGIASREEELGAAARDLGAIGAAARDLGAKALEVFAVAVSQALELGAPLAEALAAQSVEVRAQHRAEIEREIERAPDKLLIPTATLILPALLLSILGPLLAAGGMI